MPGAGMSAKVVGVVQERGHERTARPFDGYIRQQMSCVREAFRLRRLASEQRQLHALYDEHNLFAEARGARREMMHLLRTARASWRHALGLVP